jgi:mRNA interferase MazF
MIYKQWDIIKIPFPFVDSPKSKPRPVLVLSNEDFAKANGHIVTAMITTGKNSKWKYDVDIENLSSAGLSKKCVIRMKFFTLDLRLEHKKIGSLSVKDQKNFIKNFKSALF